MQQSPINNVQPEQELNNEQMTIDTTSCPTIAKPIVGCSASKSYEYSFGIDEFSKETKTNSAQLYLKGKRLV